MNRDDQPPAFLKPLATVTLVVGLAGMVVVLAFVRIDADLHVTVGAQTGSARAAAFHSYPKIVWPLVRIALFPEDAGDAYPSEQPGSMLHRFAENHLRGWTQGPVGLLGRPIVFHLTRGYVPPRQMMLFFINSWHFGGDLSGVDRAAERWFKRRAKTLDELTTARLVVAMIDPEAYHPLEQQAANIEKAQRLLRLFRGHCRRADRSDTVWAQCATEALSLQRKSPPPPR
jgi:hypothetical protein